MTRAARILAIAAVLLGSIGSPAMAQTPGPVTATPAGAAPAAASPAAAPLTLDAAMARALEANKSIAAARLQRPIDIAGVDVARERPNPDVEYDSARETPRQAVTATFPIELGGKRQRRIDVAQATIVADDASLAVTIAGVRNDVRRAYFALAAAEARVAVADDVRTLAARARDAAHARFTAGDAARIDDVQAGLDLAAADNDLTAARGERAAAEAELNVLLGETPGTSVTLADPLTSGAVPALADALAAAMRSNVDLTTLDRQIDEEIARRDLAKAEETPDISAGGSVTWDAEPDFGVGWRSAVIITVPLFTRHRAGVLVEDATLAQLRAERQARAARISAAVAAAISRATAALAQMTQYQDDVLPELSDLDTMAEASYRAGQSDLTSFLTALRSTRDARQRGLDASLTFQQALADLEQAMGTALR